ncbi:MAG: biosynthetic arginine decarboxylase [Granulosicoccus sp.]
MNADPHPDSPPPSDDNAYGIDLWGADYLQTMPNGDMGLLNPLNPDAPPVSLPSMISNLEARGIQTPLLIRVAPYLKHSIDYLNTCFTQAMESFQYQGQYRGVFPIKVNQQAQVVDRIVEYGAPHHFGLEAGSKPELVVALSHQLSSEALIICNGVKDAEFIDLAIRSRQLGFNTTIVLESLSELDLVIAVTREIGLEPMLGVRIKLNHKVSGNWAESSGDRSSFGLSINQTVALIDKLKDAGLLHCLTLQHSHLGSQIPDVNDIRRAVTEACRVFTELSREGAPLDYLDLGGGLGIDYTGQKTATGNSTNYTTAEYCTNIVESVGYAMQEAGLAHPTIVTESGRAVVAHSSFLVFSVLDATHYDDAKMPVPAAGDHHLIADLAAIKDYVCAERIQECLNDALYYRDELRNLFSLGNIDLRQMGRAEQIFLHISALIKAEVNNGSHQSVELEERLNELVDIYHGNFSLFQSLPDVWAIDQLHPIAPLQRLNETPQRRAIFSDITCDSDGKIDKFITRDGESSALPVHELSGDESYYVGVFFIGAYQETLGDLHNLFGDTNVVTIDLDDKGGFKLLHEVEGDSISDVLYYVEYNPRRCMDAFKDIVEQAVGKGNIGVRERKNLIAAYRGLMNGYTYYVGSETQ